MRISELSERFFRFKERGTHPYKEVMAGITAFLTMAYALVLVPTLLAGHGMHFESVMTATVLTAITATILMGILANYPFIVAPGVAMVAYVHYVMMQKWHMPWQAVMGTIFLVGVLLIILTFLKVRNLIVATVPGCLRVAAIAGIGVFLIVIGLQNGGLLLRKEWFFTLPSAFTFSHLMVLIGLVLTGILWILRFPAALFLGMVVVWSLSIFLGHAHIQHVASLPHSLSPTLLKLDVMQALQPKYLSALLSLLFVALFDSTGALMSLAHQLKLGPLHVQRVFTCDAVGSFMAGCLGTSPAALYLESLSAIAVGARTGLAALVAAGCMAGALFLTPLISSMPAYLAAPVLIILGSSMVSQVKNFIWKDVTEWLPGCITLVLIPISLNIAAGIGAGYLSYCLLKVVRGKAKDVQWFSWLLAGFFLLKFLILDRF
ncbi:MAG: NCS2 family permease [Verrucomicrobia bacterium]|nr:NCS2 family permease [Verrucomicrobiota bacterium]MBS0645055.1 NCS2 family permease [Verrucomicrobiota bacterium]